jgi:endonuclease/exonuclease/phosphatase family metal-dependent hydrolase
VWIITGDFNFTEDAEEYSCIRRMNFIDAVNLKVSAHGTGTKASGFGNDPTLNLDYVFAGPKFVSLNPLIERHGIESKNNRVIHEHEVRASDHYPTIATIPLNVSSLSEGG